MKELTGHEWINKMDIRFQPIFRDPNIIWCEPLDYRFKTIDNFIMNALIWTKNEHIEKSII